MLRLSENGRRILERWTLLVGGVEMMIGAAIAAFPDAFPPWLTIVALAIAIVTLGVGFTLVWTDITKLAATLHVRPSWIGPVVSTIGLAIIAVLGLWYFIQAPKGTFAGSSIGVVLVASILVVSFVFLIAAPNGTRAQEGKPVPKSGENSPEIEKNRLRDRIRILDRALHRLMNLEIDRLERVVMTQLIAESPSYSDDEDISANAELMSERTLLLRPYLSLVSSELKNMRGREDIQRIIDSAEFDEVQRLKTSPNVGPGVNAHVYRDYMVALAQRRRVIVYMKNAIEKSERADMQYLGDMVAHEKNLEPKIFDSGF